MLQCDRAPSRRHHRCAESRSPPRTRRGLYVPVVDGKRGAAL